ncbi:MAG TPA: MarR family transcriptional regulator [Pseudonocardia sp.]
MDEDALREEVLARLIRFIAGVVLHNSEVSRRVGLGPSDSQFLGLLATEGPLTPGQLATMTGLTTGTVTGVLDRLERGGFVRRERDAADRRKVLVVPVPAGQARLTAHYAEHGAHTGAVLASRDAAQLQVIADFLGELNASPGGMVSGEPA